MSTVSTRLTERNSPDKNPGASHEKFQAIQGAYEVLIDPDQRQAYDRFGNGNPGRPGNPGDTYGGGFDFDDMFGNSFGDDFFFHGMGGSSRHGPTPNRKRRKTRGDDQKIELSVTLEEAYAGKEKTFEIDKRIICPRCEG